ncbi:hypothetical protein BC829DRAFT_418778 [Chytridium lagenaria]|nr:hypothetical protein BC829DRAFT_418778 [Chytridium lagenaria]
MPKSSSFFAGNSSSPNFDTEAQKRIQAYMAPMPDVFSPGMFAALGMGGLSNGLSSISEGAGSENEEELFNPLMMATFAKALSMPTSKGLDFLRQKYSDITSEDDSDDAGASDDDVVDSDASSVDVEALRSNMEKAAASFGLTKANGRPFLSKLTGIEEGCGGDKRKMREVVSKKSLRAGLKEADTEFPFPVRTAHDIKMINDSWEKTVSTPSETSLSKTTNSRMVSFSEAVVRDAGEIGVDNISLDLKAGDEFMGNDGVAYSADTLKEKEAETESESSPEATSSSQPASAAVKPSIIPMDSGFQSWRTSNPLSAASATDSLAHINTLSDYSTEVAPFNFKSMRPPILPTLFPERELYTSSTEDVHKFGVGPSRSPKETIQERDDGEFSVSDVSEEVPRILGLRKLGTR